MIVEPPREGAKPVADSLWPDTAPLESDPRGVALWEASAGRSPADSAWPETAPLESDPRGAALWEASAAAPPSVAARPPVEVPAARPPASAPVRPVRVQHSAFVPDDLDEPTETFQRVPARRPNRLVALLAVFVVVGGGSFFVLKPQAATPVERPLAAGVPAAAVVAASPASSVVPASAAPIDAAAAAQTLAASPTAAGAVAEPAPAPASAAPLAPERAAPMRRVPVSERPSAQVSAAIAAAQQKADSFLSKPGAEAEAAR